MTITETYQKPTAAPGSLIAVSYMASLGALYFNIQPVYVGAISETLKLGEQAIGNLSSLGLFSAFIGLASSFFWVTRVNARGAVFAGLIVSLIATAILFFSSDYSSVVVSSILMGAGMALIYSPTLVVLSSMPDPTRAFAMAITTMVFVAGLIVLVTPTILVPLFGLQGLAALLFTLLLLGFGTLRAIPGGRLNQTTSGVSSHTGMAWLGLLAMAIFFVGINAVWGFFELIGKSSELDNETIGFSLAFSLVIGATGSILAGIIGNRLQTIATLTLAGSGILLSVAMMKFVPAAIGFPVSLVFFNISLNFCLPFLMETISATEDTGRYVALIPASQMMGAGVGLALGGSLYESVGVDALYVVLVASCAIAFLMHIQLHRRLNSAE